LSIPDANNKFAIDMYKSLNSDTDNVFFSPYSIFSAIGMLYEGANGKTKDEIGDVFYFPSDDANRLMGLKDLNNVINKKEKKYSLHVANALWMQKEYKLLESYLKTVKDNYDGELRNLDFKKESEKSRVTINKWVEDKTNDKIKDLIPPGVINSLTRLVLTNAIYFKGDWKREFNEKNTRPDLFRSDETTEIWVDMMQSTDEKSRFRYTENKNVQVLELPYSGEELSMILLLPKYQTEDEMDPMIAMTRVEKVLSFDYLKIKIKTKQKCNL